MLDKTDFLAIVFEFLYPYRFIFLYGGGGYLLFIGIFFSFKREENKGMLKKIDTQILIHTAIASFLTTMGVALIFVGFQSQDIILFAFYYCNLLPTIIFVVTIWIVLHFTKRASEKN